MNFQGMGCRSSVDRCLSVCLLRGPVVGPGEGIRLQGTVRDSGRRTPEIEHLSLRELC